MPCSLRKKYLPFPFMDHMLDGLEVKRWYFILVGYSGSNQISIALEDQEDTTFTCPYGTFSLKRMLFELCNGPNFLSRCTMSIFSNMLEDTIEVFLITIQFLRTPLIDVCTAWLRFSKDVKIKILFYI